ncbi:olfactory receptor 5V1-like [Hyperolius riggenbachi]|uniref:olfactory receptor 5V1-like n=1 Tax=Hyperolius riggenbachi TaxID=752182 RepID=UPI0035A30305
MATKNESSSDDFTLLVFLGGQILYTALIADIYAIIITGNFAVFSIIRADSHLHTPMYFFLSCLSLLDICYATVTVPSMLANSITGNIMISFNSCLMQIFFFVFCGGTECLLLASMAYDRYVAICNPLRYMDLLNPAFCLRLVAGCCFLGSLNSMLHTVMTLQLTFCGVRHINHFFCDVIPMLEAACGNIHNSRIVLHVETVALGASTFLVVVISYVRIISTILQIQSSARREKVFSTCSSHLTIVIMFYITGTFSYNAVNLGDSVINVRVVSVLYSVFPPLLNPVIYCLRNKEVHSAFKRAFANVFMSVL